MKKKDPNTALHVAIPFFIRSSMGLCCIEMIPVLMDSNSTVLWFVSSRNFLWHCKYCSKTDSVFDTGEWHATDSILLTGFKTAHHTTIGHIRWQLCTWSIRSLQVNIILKPILILSGILYLYLSISTIFQTFLRLRFQCGGGVNGKLVSFHIQNKQSISSFSVVPAVFWHASFLLGFARCFSK